jgi:hypothetical protein
MSTFLRSYDRLEGEPRGTPWEHLLRPSVEIGSSEQAMLYYILLSPAIQNHSWLQPATQQAYRRRKNSTECGPRTEAFTPVVLFQRRMLNLLCAVIPSCATDSLSVEHDS